MTPLLAAWLFLSPSHAADPCEGVALGDGVVTTTLVLPAAEPSEAARACIDEVGRRLAPMAGLRTVTVTARVPDAARVDGSGTAAAAAYVDRLVAVGIPASRVSAVVAAGDAPGRVYVSYTERTASPEVGSVTSASGDVRTGPSLAALTAVSAGTKLLAEGWVQTGPTGSASLTLADGSRVRVRPDTQLQVGKLTLGEDLQRVVELHVGRGGIDTEVTAAPAGSAFQVRTPYGTAGVRGTVFRVSTDASTRVETLEGLVALEGASGTAAVAAGTASRVDASGVPSEPSALARAPEPRAPLEGPVKKSGLAWAAVPGAVAYVVEIAGDAEFVLDLHTRMLDSRKAPAPTTPGHWYWRVAAVDAEGFTGNWSPVHGFDVE